jgi:hypothetical protein
MMPGDYCGGLKMQRSMFFVAIFFSSVACAFAGGVRGGGGGGLGEDTLHIPYADLTDPVLHRADFDRISGGSKISVITGKLGGKAVVRFTNAAGDIVTVPN